MINRYKMLLKTMISLSLPSLHLNYQLNRVRRKEEILLAAPRNQKVEMPTTALNRVRIQTSRKIQRQQELQLRPKVQVPPEAVRVFSMISLEEHLKRLLLKIKMRLLLARGLSSKMFKMMFKMRMEMGEIKMNGCKKQAKRKMSEANINLLIFVLRN